MKLKAKFTNKAKDIKDQLGMLYYASKDTRIGIFPKLIIGTTILYAVSPIDLIPDFIPILGYFDDLLIIPGLIFIAIKLIPQNVLIEAKEKALVSPITIKKNWFFGIIFIGIWLLVIAMLIKIIIGKWKFL